MTKSSQCSQTSVLSHTSGLDTIESLHSYQSPGELCKWLRGLSISPLLLPLEPCKASVVVGSSTACI